MKELKGSLWVRDLGSSQENDTNVSARSSWEAATVCTNLPCNSSQAKCKTALGVVGAYTLQREERPSWSHSRLWKWKFTILNLKILFFFFLPSHTFFKLSALLTGRQRPQDACRIHVTSNTASAWMHPSSSLATVQQRLLPLLLEPRH